VCVYVCMCVCVHVCVCVSVSVALTSALDERYLESQTLNHEHNA
jgi:hypothetical protein